jgi:Uma2 family endonuclease
MPTKVPRVLLEVRYYDAAQRYLRSLPLEHFIEATPQATQRKITLESLDLLEARRPDVHVFNELLVQYPRGKGKPLGQVVPDNMVVVHPKPIKAEGSYDVPLQPARPFWVLEYVSKSNRRKDYDENMRKYEHELKVPYYLLFVPDEQELTLYRYGDRRYASVKRDSRRLGSLLVQRPTPSLACRFARVSRRSHAPACGNDAPGRRRRAGIRRVA